MEAETPTPRPLTAADLNAETLPIWRDAKALVEILGTGALLECSEALNTAIDDDDAQRWVHTRQAAEILIHQPEIMDAIARLESAGQGQLALEPSGTVH